MPFGGIKTIFHTQIYSPQRVNPNLSLKFALDDLKVQVEKANLIIMMNVLFATYCFVDSGTEERNVMLSPPFYHLVL